MEKGETQVFFKHTATTDQTVQADLSFLQVHMSTGTVWDTVAHNALHVELEGITDIVFILSRK